MKIQSCFAQGTSWVPLRHGHAGREEPAPPRPQALRECPRHDCDAGCAQRPCTRRPLGDTETDSDVPPFIWGLPRTRSDATSSVEAFSSAVPGHRGQGFGAVCGAEPVAGGAVQTGHDHGGSGRAVSLDGAQRRQGPQGPWMVLLRRGRSGARVAAMPLHGTTVPPTCPLESIALRKNCQLANHSTTLTSKQGPTDRQLPSWHLSSPFLLKT